MRFLNIRDFRAKSSQIWQELPEQIDTYYFRPKFQFNKEQIATLINFIHQNRIFVSTSPLKSRLPDSDFIDFNRKKETELQFASDH